MITCNIYHVRYVDRSTILISTTITHLDHNIVLSCKFGIHFLVAKPLSRPFSRPFSRHSTGSPSSSGRFRGLFRRNHRFVGTTGWANPLFLITLILVERFLRHSGCGLARCFFLGCACGRRTDLL